jgi:hypothetical protein
MDPIRVSPRFLARAARRGAPRDVVEAVSVSFGASDASRVTTRREGEDEAATPRHTAGALQKRKKKNRARL